MKSFVLFTLVLIGLGATGCNKGGPSFECKQKSIEFEQLTSGYFKGCIKTCFNVAASFSPEKIDKIKDQCDRDCRTQVPFKEINKIKESINSNYNCNLDYKRSL